MINYIKIRKYKTLNPVNLISHYNLLPFPEFLWLKVLQSKGKFVLTQFFVIEFIYSYLYIYLVRNILLYETLISLQETTK